MTHADWVRAAALTLPADARPTGLTRLRQLGLEVGDPRPLHFVVARDHHVQIDGIRLHRTERMPVTDEEGVVPAAAFLALCAESTVVTAASVGDWLLRHGHLQMIELRELAQRERWRAGAVEALWISRLLDPRSLSLPESAWRLRCIFSGLPRPDVNVPLVDARGTTVAMVDLAYLKWNTVVEYEGQHHQRDRGQYLNDLARYRDLRDLAVSYVQLTRETPPVAGILAIHRSLRAHGYDGPPPAFGARWRQLDSRLARVARRR